MRNMHPDGHFAYAPVGEGEIGYECEANGQAIGLVFSVEGRERFFVAARAGSGYYGHAVLGGRGLHIAGNKRYVGQICAVVGFFKAVNDGAALHGHLARAVEHIGIGFNKEGFHFKVELDIGSLFVKSNVGVTLYYCGFINALEDDLNIAVDVLTYDSLKDSLVDVAVGEEVVLYEG